MRSRRLLTFLTRLALVLIAVFMAMGLCLAQMQNNGKSPAQTGPFRSPQNVMKMRSLTQAQREAAAARNAARIAEYKASHGKSQKGGGK